MIELHPRPTISYHCPKCKSVNQPQDWLIPGMRNLAVLFCQSCNFNYYADLPAGHGLTYPMCLDPATGEVYDERGIEWFAQWLGESFLNRSSTPIGLHVKELRPVRKPILLNCLDVLYGHSLSKLFNAQYYIDHCPEYDLIVVIQPFLSWLIPDGTAQVWTVDLPLRRGTEWNDSLASEIKRRISQYSECMLSVAFLHPHPDDLSIERFVGVAPMDLQNWNSSDDTPVITFIWRDDRVWAKQTSNILRRSSGEAIKQQKKNVIQLTKSIRNEFPKADFAVAGLGTCGPLPDGIQDLTSVSVDESLERAWCERYSKSHIVVGVHGSNMHLPSALAGSTIELIGEDRYGNAFQDIQATPGDIRGNLFRYRLLPLSTDPETISTLATSIFRKYPGVSLNFEKAWNDHELIRSDPWMRARKSKEFFGKKFRV